MARRARSRPLRHRSIDRGRCRPSERLLPARFFQPVDVPDVGMVERGEDFGFTLKARQPIRIVGERLGQARYTSPIPPSPILAVT